MSTVGLLLAEGGAALKETSATPRLDAELLLAHVSGVERIRFIAEPERSVAAPLVERYRALIERRRGFEPIAYLVGRKEFYGLDFEVSPAVLVPRPETELLVELALASVAEGPLRVLDLGTGSGCIAVALVHELRKRGLEVAGVCVDKSRDALEVARRNIARHGLTDTLELRLGDWFEALNSADRFNLILSNPPYIKPGDPDVSPELRHEPSPALYAAEEGLGDLRTIIEHGQRYLLPGGVILCEFGARQREQLSRLASGLEFFCDLAGHDRVLRLRR